MPYFLFGLLTLLSNYVMTIYERFYALVHDFIFGCVMTSCLCFGIYSLYLVSCKKKNSNKIVHTSENITLNKEDDESLIDKGNNLANKYFEQRNLIIQLKQSSNPDCQKVYQNIISNAALLNKTLGITQAKKGKSKNEIKKKSEK